jgi:integrase
VTGLIPHTPGHIGVALPARQYAEESRAANTRRAYSTDWRIWTEWCVAKGRQAMPASPEDIGEFLAEQATTHRPGTLGRRLASLSVAHKMAGFASPCGDAYVHSVMEGIARTYGVAPRRRTPVLLEGLLAAVATCDQSLTGIRDAAILTLAWGSACRRSELADLEVSDVEPVDDGLLVTVRRSKTDQAGTGQVVAVPHADGANQPACPPCRLYAWLEAARIDSGRLFRRVAGQSVGDSLTGQSVGNVIRERMQRAGLPGNWGGHSTRAGLVTQAARNGVDITTIMQQTRHRRADQVMAYVREADLFHRNAAALAFGRTPQPEA